MAHRVLLFLGAGRNIGALSVALFKSKGYKVAAVARTIKADVEMHSDMHLTADFSDPQVMEMIFEKVEQELGVPNVVVYNRKSCFSLRMLLYVALLRCFVVPKESSSVQYRSWVVINKVLQCMLLGSIGLRCKSCLLVYRP